MNREDEQLISWHAQSIDDVMDSFSVSKDGLSNQDAQKRLEEYGRNELPIQPPGSIVRIFFSQFTNPLIIILIFAVVASAVLTEWLDVTVISIAILLNTILGFFEEYKADRSLYALKQYLPVTVKIKREGETKIIPASEIVPGDIMLLAAGDRITADARIIYEEVFEVQEASLTGESSSVKKQIENVNRKSAIGNRLNMVFAGTIVMSGHAEAIVVATALETEIGKITELVLDVIEEKTPLQENMAYFAKVLSVGIIFLSILVFAIGIVRGVDTVEMFKIAIAITVSAIPEGLIVAVTVILAIGMRRILKKHALVRRLIAAETLGSVRVICTDKTGTLTTGEMVIDEIKIKGERVVDSSKSADYLELLRILYYTNGVIVGSRDDVVSLSGSQTEVAIMKFLLPKKDSFIDKNLKSLNDLPFDSKNKFSARIVENGGNRTLFAVGAPDILIERADISDKTKKGIIRDFEEMVGRGLRVLIVVKKENMPQIRELKQSDVTDVEVVGLIGLQDPLRAEATETIEEARRAGLLTVMITGDHPETALMIAKQAGLEATHRSMLTGIELDELTDDELVDRLEKTTVFARVSPHHKLRIVHAWQRRGVSVAMTGDGVNDAPALKAADIGIALGSGTEVAKETADIVLLDNNFKTIVDAVREGRIIFDNLRKMIVYLLSDSFSAILLILGALLFALPLPILPAQILWINLITDGLPSLALTFEPGEKGVMNEPPRKKNEPILNSEMKVLIFIVGIVTDIMLFAIYFYLLGQQVSIEEIRTFIFVALGTDSLLYVFAIRKFRSSIFRSNPFENKYLVAGVFIGFLLLVAPLVIVPLKELFGFVTLAGLEWFILIIMAFIQLVFIEIVKEIYNRKRMIKN